MLFRSISAFFQISLAGTAQVIQRSLPLLQSAPSPHVINIVADWGFPMHNIMTGPSLYIAAKYGLHGLGAALQTELGKHNIRTTNLCPGIVAANTEYGTDDSSFEAANGNSAIHPGDLAKAIDFILDAKYSHIRSIVLSPTNPEYNGV